MDVQVLCMCLSACFSFFASLAGIWTGGFTGLISLTANLAWFYEQLGVFDTKSRATLCFRRFYVLLVWCRRTIKPRDPRCRGALPGEWRRHGQRTATVPDAMHHWALVRCATLQNCHYQSHFCLLCELSRRLLPCKEHSYSWAPRSRPTSSFWCSFKWPTITTNTRSLARIRLWSITQSRH